MTLNDDQKRVVDVLTRQSAFALDASFSSRGRVWTEDLESIFVEHQGAMLHAAKLHLGDLSRDEETAVALEVSRQFGEIKKSLTGE